MGLVFGFRVQDVGFGIQDRESGACVGPHHMMNIDETSAITLANSMGRSHFAKENAFFEFSPRVHVKTFSRTRLFVVFLRVGAPLLL